MRFKKGTLVEVLNTRAVPSGSWWHAKIVSGNGQSYRVRYDQSPPDMAGAVLERVPGTLLRPCPPQLQCPRSWLSGDIVEVFDNGSWKLAEILKVVGGGDHFFVRLVGSSSTFKVQCSNMRIRLSWQDQKWITVGKDRKCRRTSPSLRRVQNYTRHNHFAMESGASFLESHGFFPRGLKRRSLFYLSSDDGCAQVNKKHRAMEKDATLQRLLVGDSCRLPEKVDAVTSTENPLGEKYMPSSYNTMAGNSEVLKRGEPYADAGCLLTQSLEPNNEDNDACSICSSTDSNNLDTLCDYSLTYQNPDLDYCSDDALSSRGPESRRKESFPSQLNVATEVHKLELHAYHSTVGALYASGSISWEQEALMTDLRLMLHISNDEHLMEIRQLASGSIWRLIKLAYLGPCKNGACHQLMLFCTL